MKLWKGRDPAMVALLLFVGGGVAVSVVLGLLVVLRSTGKKPPESPAAAYDRDAARKVRDLWNCLLAHKAAHKGFPATLDGRDRTLAECRSSEDPRDGVIAGHRLLYVPALPDASGSVPAFTLCARAVDFGRTAAATIVVDQATLHDPFAYKDNRVAAASCAQAWFGVVWDTGQIAAVRHCVMAYAAAHPDQGYPAELSAVGPAGDGCLAPGRSVSIERDVLTWDNDREKRLAYLPGPPDERGRILRYEIHHLFRRHAWTDETGALHLPEETDARLWRQKTLEEQTDFRRGRGPNRGNLPWLERECRAGRAANCVEWGAALVRSGKEGPASWNLAVTAYDMACRGGSAEGCLRAGEGVRAAHGGVDASGCRACASFERACALGSGEGCWEIVRCLDDTSCPRRSLSAVASMERACEASVRPACIALAQEKWSGARTPRDPARAMALLEEACLADEAAACGPLGRFHLQGPAADPAAARRFFRRGCALAAQEDSCAALDVDPVQTFDRLERRSTAQRRARRGGSPRWQPAGRSEAHTQRSRAGANGERPVGVTLTRTARAGLRAGSR